MISVVPILEHITFIGGDNQMKDASVMMVLIDAFSFRYLSRDHTPFLYLLAGEGHYTQIQPMFAYRGIEASIFTGTTPNTHKIWTEFCLREKKRANTVSQILKECCKFTDKIPSDFLHRVMRCIYWRLDKKIRPVMIPAIFLDYFETTQLPITTPDAFPVPTIFDILRKEKRKYLFLTPHKGKDDIVFKTVYKLIENEEKDFWFIKFETLDQLGHRYGPNSSKMREALKNIDRFIYKLYLRFRERYKSGVFIVLSDHGMNHVNSIINIKRKLDGLPLTPPKDYIYFIDSTMTRFWFFNEKAKKLTLDALSKINAGRILGDNELRMLGIDKIGHRYGEIIFVLKEGYVFFPDFFRWDTPPRGMHGYAFESDKPIFIIHGDNVTIRDKSIRFIDIMPTVLKILNLQVPSTCEGVSVLRE